jgi:hypothetical protein
MRSFPVCLVLAVTGCALAQASVDRDLLAMAPPETTLLTGIDVTRAQESPFGAYLLRQMRTDDDHFKEFMGATGFDPRRDLQEVLFVGLAEKNGQDSRFAIFARGNFDQARIQSAAEAKGATVTMIDGVTVLLIKKHGESGQKALAFPQPGIAVLGDVATIREALSPGGTGGALDTQLLDQVNRVGVNNDLWFATLMSGAFLNHELGNAATTPGMANGMANSAALQSILKSAGGLQFGDTVAMSLDLVTRSPEDAKSVTDLLRFAGNLMQMQQNNPRANAAASALSSMQVETTGSNVHASLGITEQQLELLLQSEKSTAAPKQQ